MSSLLDLTPCSALCGLCILVDTTNATFFTHAAGLRDCCFLARQNVGHLGYDGFETLEIFLYDASDKLSANGRADAFEGTDSRNE